MPISISPTVLPISTALEANETCHEEIDSGKPSENNNYSFRFWNNDGNNSDGLFTRLKNQAVSKVQSTWKAWNLRRFLDESHGEGDRLVGDIGAVVVVVPAVEKNSPLHIIKPASPPPPPPPFSMLDPVSTNEDNYNEKDGQVNAEEDDTVIHKSGFDFLDNW